MKQHTSLHLQRKNMFQKDWWACTDFRTGSNCMNSLCITHFVHYSKLILVNPKSQNHSWRSFLQNLLWKKVSFTEMQSSSHLLVANVSPREAEPSWNRTIRTLFKLSLFWLQMYSLLSYLIFYLFPFEVL